MPHLTRTLPLLALLVLAVLPGPLPKAGPLDVPVRQVLIEAKLVSVQYRDEIRLGLNDFRGGQRLTPEACSEFTSLATLAKTSDQNVLNMLDEDPSLAGTEQGQAVQAGVLGSIFQTDIMLDLMFTEGKLPRARSISRPNLNAMNHDTATITVLQDRHRFTDDRRGQKDAQQYREDQFDYLSMVSEYGLPFDPAAIFENFDGKPRRTLLDRTGFGMVNGLKAKAGKGALTLSGTGRDPQTGYLVFTPQVTDDFTILITIQLPRKINRKGREALDGVTHVTELASDMGQPPSEFVQIGNQFTSDGFAQTYFANQNGVQMTIPHPTLSTRRAVTNVIVKDGSTVVLGGIVREDDGSTSSFHDQLPILSKIPILSSGLFNATKKTKIEQRNLLIFLTPHVVDFP